MRFNAKSGIFPGPAACFCGIGPRRRGEKRARKLTFGPGKNLLSNKTNGGTNGCESMSGKPEVGPKSPAAPGSGGGPDRPGSGPITDLLKRFASEPDLIN